MRWFRDQATALPVIHHKVDFTADFTAVRLVPGPLSTTASVGPGGMGGLGWAHQVGPRRLVTSNRPQGFPGSCSKVPSFSPGPRQQQYLSERCERILHAVPAPHPDQPPYATKTHAGGRPTCAAPFWKARRVRSPRPHFPSARARKPPFSARGGLPHLPGRAGAAEHVYATHPGPLGDVGCLGAAHGACRVRSPRPRFVGRRFARGKRGRCARAPAR